MDSVYRNSVPPFAYEITQADSIILLSIDIEESSQSSDSSSPNHTNLSLPHNPEMPDKDFLFLSAESLHILLSSANISPTFLYQDTFSNEVTI